MSDPCLAQSFVPLLAVFAESFTTPTFVTFRHLIAGWILCIGRHTVTGVLRASGAIGVKHHTTFHRFFRTAVWDPDQIGMCLLKLVMTLVPTDQVILIPIDDTLGRHTGKHIRGASMHHHPLLSTRTKVVWHWGHVWVVLSIVIQVPIWNKAFALPVLCRLYRSQKVCKKERRPFFKKTELAAQMVTLVANALKNRRLCIVGDAAYANASVVKPLPPNADFIGRARLDAALYAPPKQKRMGRPRVKGDRLPSPQARARSAKGWTTITATVYDRRVKLKIKTFDALWYVVGGGRLMRFVLIRNWPGHKQDDVLCCTDLSLTAEQIIARFALRWKLEVTFEEAKGKLGFEDPQNRTDKAVQRTAPFALWVYTLTVVWYVTLAQRLGYVRLPLLPWYKKSVPTFSDMLAALRREFWARRLLDPAHSPQSQQKSMEDLVLQVGYAA